MAALVCFLRMWKQMEINFMWHIMQHSLKILPLSGVTELKSVFDADPLLKFPQLREGACESVKFVRL